jgi:hypothetical protein
MHTKKTLGEQFSIARGTVNSTLKIIGLDPKRDDFTDEEVELFKRARELQAEGKTKEQVAQELGLNFQEDSTEKKEDLLTSLLMQSTVETMQIRGKYVAKEAVKLMPFILKSALEAEAEGLVEILRQDNKNLEEKMKKITLIDDEEYEEEENNPKGLSEGN